tara:strand:+ start:395 stop:688 length:294 start_codon:yes stop_codon:yes gene_type:complete
MGIKNTHKGTTFQHQTKHAGRKFKQLNGIPLTPNLRREFRGLIRERRLMQEDSDSVIFLEESRGYEIYDINYKGKTHRTVYDPTTKNLVTFLERQER